MKNKKFKTKKGYKFKKKIKFSRKKRYIGGKNIGGLGSLSSLLHEGAKVTGLKNLGQGIVTGTASGVSAAGKVVDIAGKTLDQTTRLTGKVLTALGEEEGIADKGIQLSSQIIKDTTDTANELQHSVQELAQVTGKSAVEVSKDLVGSGALVIKKSAQVFNSTIAGIANMSEAVMLLLAKIRDNKKKKRELEEQAKNKGMDDPQYQEDIAEYERMKIQNDAKLNIMKEELKNAVEQAKTQQMSMKETLKLSQQEYVDKEEKERVLKHLENKSKELEKEIQCIDLLNTNKKKIKDARIKGFKRHNIINLEGINTFCKKITSCEVDGKKNSWKDYLVGPSCANTIEFYEDLKKKYLPNDEKPPKESEAEAEERSNKESEAEEGPNKESEAEEKPQEGGKKVIRKSKRKKSRRLKTKKRKKYRKLKTKKEKNK